MLDKYKERFDWPPQEYVNLNERTDVSRGHVFVTGASENHYEFVYYYNCEWQIQDFLLGSRGCQPRRGGL